jgi:hypothetical protein
MAQDNWWANDPVVSTTPRPSAPPPVTNNAPPPFIGGTVSPTKQAADARDQTRTTLAVEGAARDDRRETRDVTNKAFDQEAKLRDDFNMNPQVKAYRNSMPMLSQALRAPKNGQGDLSVIYAYAKLMDPDSVVRESEMTMVTLSSPMAQMTYQKLIGQLDGSGRLPPATRRRLDQEMIRTTQARRKAYDAQFKDYGARAGQYGLDPFAVVGTHAGEMFRAEMQDYDKERGIGRFANKKEGAPGGVVIPEMSGGLPKGTTPVFNMDRPEVAFDRAKYVQEKYGVTPDQEDWITAFWNQNAGNGSLTPEGVKQAYTQAGINPPPDDSIVQGIDYARKGYAFSAFDTTQAEEEYKAGLQRVTEGANNAIDPTLNDPNSGAAYLDRAKTGATLGLRDELEGVGGFLGRLVTGGNPVEGYKINRDADRMQQEQQHQAQGVAGQIVEFGGSIPTALAVPGALSRNVGQAAKAGGIVGGTQGFGYGEGPGGSTVNALVGATLGSATGATVQGGMNRLASRSVKPNALASDARQIVDAGAEWNVPVKTSDIRPPQTPVGRTARLTGEMIPVAGTGGGMGGRATQQASREEAVQRFVKEFGGDPASIDDVTADLVATRGKELSTLTKAKDSVIDGIADPLPPMAMRNTLRTIDTQIAKLNKANSEAFAPVVSKLENFRNTLASGKSLREVEMNRRLLGDLFADPSLASIKGGGQKALNEVYAPLRDDMGAFIESKVGSQARSKWKGANDRLSAMAGELDDAKFRNVLKKADTTPERVADMLFSKTPSDVRRLVGGLSEEGKIRARSAIIYKAAKESTADDVISPDKFKQAMMAMDNATGVVFSKNDKTRIDGFTRLLEATQRAKIANTEVMTGARNTGYIAGYGLGQLFGNAVIPASAMIGLMARGYESAAFRNLMMNLGKSKKGSPAEEAVGRKVYDYITRAGITQGTPANDIAAERIGSSFGQSTTAAAAGEQEQN